ncbi:ABC transporter ATP-binding protein [Agrobacterium rhizogenes]|uniref:ATPase component of various ABC-type transport systems, contain duplicated ATPase n=1 Tax=Rhizobium rhizogenes (strain K84 / ATCC BAA-868) TaxID=311403 RepID=B9JQC8_RHIR8|nr:ABC transporter ATP-binding protein [Rhizobium rhizogenes]ACM31347.1 ATPase component of various ABC-type transport systems, contain duplicated ATPase [Rhizobium rhizogenes K84]OCJ22057.1 ABC transporter ATP-binding protein [Agrobacterium sp. B131/95]OCJ24426.1 ABC transporter ATP-binding protein [Agrobacterium sp. B133/95]NTI46295.1 ABC transporter ATP-binding protein [Rhizobium rhizogenes]NTI52978.1 ABC transporter ATP-binding protein [Rhizobium rhizogenes]
MLHLSEKSHLLTVENLSVTYGHDAVVDQASFTLRRSRALALIGESGSGKSTIAKAVLGLLPETAKTSGKIGFKGSDLLRLNDYTWRPLRGRAIGFVPQDPQNALNPVRTIGAQAHEAARLLNLPDRAAERAAIHEIFELVGLGEPERIYRSYPHQLSGGMLQRVLIGLAVLPKPDLIVADEPTSALDVTIQKRILDLLSTLRASLDLSLLLITHDLAIAAERAEDVVVLKNGKVQEAGLSRHVFLTPASDYARRLQADVPSLNPFRFRTEERRARSGKGAETQIQVQSVSRAFDVDGNQVHALKGVSFSVDSGSTHALVGESGSGKTTLARLLLGLDTPDSGAITVAGQKVHGRSAGALRDLRRDLQLVYQNPFTSLDPTWRVKNIVREPLDRYGIGTPADRDRRVFETIRAVGLGEDFLERRPAALSGGQRQRVAIARALVVQPKVLVLDEPTSALDVSVQAGIVEALFELQQRFGLTYIFVSHDLSLIRQVADTVSVLQHGRLVEDGPVDRVFEAPSGPYTRALLASIPAPPSPTSHRPW